MTGTIEGYESDQDKSDVSVVSIKNDVAVEVMGGKSRAENGDVTGKDKKKLQTGLSVRDHLTNLAHVCILAYVLLIWYLCFAHPFEFFTWHPLLLSIGWMFLMTEAVLTLSKENAIPKKLKFSHTLRIRFHWIPLTAAAVFIAAGFIVITISKNMKNKHHYTSWHGLLGLMGIVAYIPPCLNGIALLYKKDIKNYIKPKIVKFIHVVSGVASLTLGGISLILSVYTKWFGRRTEHNQYVFYFALIIVTFPVMWVIQRPLVKCLKNIYKLSVADKYKS